MPGRPRPRIWSPMPNGSGAIHVHRQLAETIQGYTVRPFNPRLEYFPPSLCLLRNEHAAIVHATPDHGALLVSGNQPLVITFHNFVLDQEMHESASLIQRLHYRTDLRWLTAAALRRATAVTAVSAYTAHLVESFFELREPVRVISNGVNTSLFHPASRTKNDKFKVLISGNASRRKGTHLIRGIAQDLDPGIEIVCTFDEQELDQWTGSPSNVRALGKQQVEAMPDVYRNADLLLMPTAREGFGLAVAEAMATGLPIVASDSSTMPALVSHGKGGYLCPLNSPAAFARRINELAAAPALRERMGEYNRDKVVKEFTMQTMINGYDALFREVEDRSRSSSDSSRRR